MSVQHEIINKVLEVLGLERRPTSDYNSDRAVNLKSLSCT